MRCVRVLLAVVCALCAIIGAGAQAQTLELKRVLLSLGGVGYFEFEAKVTGNAELALPVRLDQVDDVLKSVVVFDDKGAVGQITLPGRDSLAQTFKDLPFDQPALGSFDKLLNALAGAEITVVGQSQVSGRILAVVPETVTLPDRGGETVKHRVTVAAQDGLRQFLLEDAQSVRFADAALQAQVNQALAAVARHRLQDQRVLNVTAQGSGSRTLRVGYVVSAPLWKSTYRMTLLDANAEGQGLLQGWAVLENLSGHEWNKVELTLASGNPVTFRQQLYKAYFVQRPEVPVDVLARIAPPADRGAMTAMAAAAAPAPTAPSGAAAGVTYQRSRAMAQEFLAEADLATGDMEEGATQVLFSAPEPVSVHSGETLMLPIINRKVPVQRVALYQPGVQTGNPLAALRLTNNSGFGLPPGVITLYEQAKTGVAHIGDARLNLTPAGENRLITFAVDYKVRVDREEKMRTAITQARISRGVLTLSNRDEQTTVYRVKTPEKDSRVLLIEHPRYGARELVSPKPAEVEITPDAYRVRVALDGTGTAVQEVTTQLVRNSTVVLAALQGAQLLSYAQNGEIAEPVRKALQRLVQIQGDVDRFDAEVRDATAEADRIAKDQERLRQNLASVPANSDLAKRYLDQMKSQEDRLEQLRQVEADSRKKLSEARAGLSDAIAKLEI